MKILSNLRNIVTATLAGAPSTDFPPFPAQLTTTTADSVRDNWINSAGNHLISMHQWLFTERESITRDYVAGQNYVTLPDDFSTIVSVASTDGSNDSVSLVKYSTIVEWRNAPYEITGTGHRYAAIVWPSMPDPAGEKPNPRLELWPSITASSSGAMTIAYRSGWTELSNATDVAAVEWYAENLLEILVAAFARGWGEEDNGDLDDRLGKIENGVIFRNAKGQDGMTQPIFGRMTGGAIGVTETTNPWVLRASGGSVSDPS